jgi:hypothetical protein
VKRKSEHAVGLIMNDNQGEVLIQDIDEWIEIDIKVTSVLETVE